MECTGLVARLISAFVIRFLESIISKLAKNEISIFLLVSVAEETGLSFVLSETPKTSFLTSRPIYYHACDGLTLPDNLIMPENCSILAKHSKVSIKTILPKSQ